MAFSFLLHFDDSPHLFSSFSPYLLLLSAEVEDLRGFKMDHGVGSGCVGSIFPWLGCSGV